MYNYKKTSNKPIPEINEYLEVLGIPVIDAILATIIWMVFYIFTSMALTTISLLTVNLIFCRWKNKLQNTGDPIEFHPFVIKVVSVFKPSKLFLKDSAKIETLEEVYRE